MSAGRILIVDDTLSIVRLLKDFLASRGFETIEAYDGEAALEKFKSGHPSLVLLDLNIPKIEGLEVLKKIREADPSLPVIIITGLSSLPDAVKSIKWGISDCFSKPFDNEKLFAGITKALAVSSKESRMDQRSDNYNVDRLPQITGTSAAIKTVLELIKKVAPHNVNVLIRGDSGTGKEIMAKAVHYNSTRAGSPLVSVDCSAIPENLIESELFGYEKGAFTGADSKKIGKFEAADKGTIFLDEIGNLSLNIQIKLLRVLQEREIVHLGGNTPVKIDVRLITATSTNLEEAKKKSLFREDFYQRLSEFIIYLPPLKDRKEDILFLMDLFLKEFNIEFNKKLMGFTPRVKELLLKYHWPGNIRELRNVVKSIVLVAEDFIEFKHLPLNIQVAVDERKEARPGDNLHEVISRATEDIERKMILQALQDTDWNHLRADKTLGVDPKTLYRKLKDYGIKENKE